MIDQAWKLISENIQNFEFKKGITSFVNPYSMLLLRSNPKVVEGVNQWCIDGISMVKLYNFTTKRKIKRFSFDDTSVVPLVFAIVKRDNLRIAVIGTEERFIHNAIANIESKYCIKVCLFRNGYFKDLTERAALIKEITNSNIDVVVCGMGTPQQEQFLIDLINSGWNGYGFSCGGYLHQIASKKDYYPKLLDKLNLRWMYRIYDEPKLITRYLIYYPVFFTRYIYISISKLFF